MAFEIITSMVPWLPESIRGIEAFLSHKIKIIYAYQY